MVIGILKRMLQITLSRFSLAAVIPALFGLGTEQAVIVTSISKSAF
jgi:hypothetical protein